MKRKIVSLLACVAFALASLGCGTNLEQDGETYETWGLFDRKTERDPAMCYEIIVGNVVWSVLLVETLVAPAYFVGFSLFEATGEPYNERCY